MSSCRVYVAILILKLIDEHHVHSVPTCIIIDTNILQRADEESAAADNHSSSSTLLRQLRMLDQQRLPSLPGLVVESIPISYIDLKQSSSLPLIDLDDSILQNAVIEPIVERPLAPCSLESLNELETQMVVPFEFRRLRIEQSDHHTKFLDDEPRETVADSSTAVYERRSDPDGVRFCRTCRDGLWSHLSICDTVRCDADLLRANPRLVTEWGEVKPLDGGALYAPSTIFAVYAFGYGPHCKRCESNGQWSRYALPEFCAEIKFFGHAPATPATTGAKVEKNLIPKVKQSTTSSMKLLNKKQ